MFFSPLFLGIFHGFSADGDGVTDRLPDELTDESDDVRTWNFPGCGMFSKFHPAVHMGIFAMILADGWMEMD